MSLNSHECNQVILSRMYTQYEKNIISAVTFKNKLATCIICSNNELKKTQVLPQNTILLVGSSLHFSLWKSLAKNLENQIKRLWEQSLSAVATFSGCLYK